MKDSILKFTLFTFLVVSVISCTEKKEEKRVLMVSNKQFVNAENGKLFISALPDTITTLDNIIQDVDSDFEIAELSGGFFYIKNAEGKILNLVKNMQPEKVDLKKLKINHLLLVYDLKKFEKIALDYYIFSINSNPEYVKFINEKIKTNNSTFEQQVQNDAKYIISKNGGYKFEDIRAMFFVNNLINNKQQNEFISKKAKERNIPVNEMILADSKWLVEMEKK